VPLDLPLLLAGGGSRSTASDDRAGPGGPARGADPYPPVAVLTMELQRGVMGDLATFPELARACREVGVVEATARLLAAARTRNLPVVHCTAGFRADRAGTVINTPLHTATLRSPDHLLEGSAAVEVVPELFDAASDVVCSRRHGVSPFTGTSLDTLLRNLGVRVVVATGVSVNVAITGLCIEAVNLGYSVVVPRDAVAGVPAAYAASVIDNTLALVAAITTTDKLIAALPPQVERSASTT
jgi:nicotinamidase-related amidase